MVARARTANERKTVQLKVRLTESQFEMLKELADKDIIPPVAWARRCLLKAIAKRLETPIRGNECNVQVSNGAAERRSPARASSSKGAEAAT